MNIINESFKATQNHPTINYFTNKSPLFIKIERVFQSLRPSLIDGAFVICTGLIAGATGVIGVAAIASAAQITGVAGSAAVVVAVVTAATARLVEITEIEAALVAAIVLISGAALAVAVLAAGAAVSGIPGALATVAIGSAGVLATSIVKILFNCLGSLEENKENVGWGLLIGATVSMLTLFSGFLTTLLTVSLVGGIAASSIAEYDSHLKHPGRL